VKLTLTAGGQTHQVTVEHQAERYRVVVDGREHFMDLRRLTGDLYHVLDGECSCELAIEPAADGYRVRLGTAECWVGLGASGRRASNAPGSDAVQQRVVSAMPGRIVRLLVQEGQVVTRGQAVIVVEAMKMENEIAAGRAGRVGAIAVRPGQAVEAGAVLLVID
jgi:biotin carboxyl carrier protein